MLKNFGIPPKYHGHIGLFILCFFIVLAMISLSSCALSTSKINKIQKSSETNNIITYIYISNSGSYPIYCSKDGLSIPVCSTKQSDLIWRK